MKKRPLELNVVLGKFVSEFGDNLKSKGLVISNKCKRKLIQILKLQAWRQGWAPLPDSVDEGGADGQLPS